jgi:hypothetical protein
MSSISEDDTKGALINPYYAIVFADYLFNAPGAPPLAREDWMLANYKLIDEVGVRNWLKELLDTLSKEPSDKSHAFVNPGEAIVLSGRLYGKHEPTVDIDTWIEANANLIKELSIEEWLWQLLKVLETGETKPD